MKITILSFLLILSAFSFSQGFVSVKKGAGINNDYAKAIDHDTNGNFYTVGTFSGTVNFDSTNTLYVLTSVGNNDVYITKHDTLGNLIWVKSIGGTFDDNVNCIKTDGSGNFFITGSFQGTIDMDPGTGVSTLTNGGGVIYVAKYSASGNLIWAKNMAGANSYGTSLDFDAGGNVIIGGYYNTYPYTVSGDFDPGPATYTLTGYASTGNGFIEKLDASGNFVWAKGFAADALSSVLVDANNDIYATGCFEGTSDFDPGVGTYTLTTPGTNQHMFLLKLNSAGNFSWVKRITSTIGKGTMLKMTPACELYTLGYSNGATDIDPGPGLSFLTGGVYILKTDTLGNTIWAKAVSSVISGTSNYIAPAMDIDHAGNIYSIGYIFPNTGWFSDFDPGPGQTILQSGNFISKLNSNGDLVWAKRSNEGGYATSRGIFADNKGFITIIGDFFGSVDFDPGPAIHSISSVPTLITEVYFLRLTQDICSSLTLVADSVLKIGCASANGKCYAHASGGLPPYTFSWNTNPVQHTATGTFSIQGIYQLTVQDSANCMRQTSVQVSGFQQPFHYDLLPYLYTAAFRPGFQSFIDLGPFNSGCTPVSGTFKFTIDPKLTFNSSVPAPSAISGDTLMWNFINLTNDFSGALIHLSVTTSSLAVLGDTVRLKCSVLPLSGDVVASNNIKDYKYIVIGAYDPNTIQVHPEGMCAERFIAKDQRLTYTIHFQNTGTADALHVNVVDSLDAGLDISTLTVIKGSHAFYTEVLPGNHLKFHFNNIHLPDSSADEQGSHGYIIYEINPLSTLADSVTIKNKAHIYFDFNAAIITNQVCNKVVTVVPENCGTIVISADPELLYSSDIRLYPNPSTGAIFIEFKKQLPVLAEIFDMFGRTVYKEEIKPAPKSTLFIDGPAGLYFIKVTGESDSPQIFKIIKE